MPKMHCNGDLAEIPDNGQICPRLKTNFVPTGARCEVHCASGSPSHTHMKCDEEGWKPNNTVTCSGSSAGLIVGLLVGGIIVVVIIAYCYARYNTMKKQKKLNDGKKKPTSSVNRALKIAQENDMITEGRNRPPSAEPVSRIKVVSGDEGIEEPSPRNSSIPSNPPSYREYMAEHEENFNENNHQRSRHSRRSNGSRDRSQHQGNYYDNGGYNDQQYYPEYPENQGEMYPANYNTGHRQSGGYYHEEMNYPPEVYQHQYGYDKPYDVHT